MVGRLNSGPRDFMTIPERMQTRVEANRNFLS